ncbi:hypothetical protein [Aureibacter tunicatorum]|uniref:Uncharacterized protein n=1 Tax=Aureibacter tunicatorum TaxID=866807 RepID=A0AAE4BQH6_9BACT|nr:hypothetical protein [Aureibacter tunicatorum]MDR6237566.1 hypothetical protein [Aureibacter tunicatorum]BDD02600.1 hypothetical protein AUTU_00830 [Aureibacter tunicatorum]
MRKYKIESLFFLLLLFISIFSCENKDTVEDSIKSIKSEIENNTYPEFALETPSEIDSEDYSIYQVILKKLNFDLIIVNQVSNSVNSAEILIENNPEVDPSLFQKLDQLNENQVIFGDVFLLEDKDVSLLPTEEKEYIFSSDDLNKSWESFYTVYPKAEGIHSFSRIAYNEDKTQAVVEVWYSYASLGGSSSSYLMKKTNDQWEVEKMLKPTVMT